MTVYISKLRKTITPKSTFYYIEICGKWTRVKKQEYINRENESFRQDSFFTIIHGKNTIQLKTVYTQY